MKKSKPTASRRDWEGHPHTSKLREELMQTLRETRLVWEQRSRESTDPLVSAAHARFHSLMEVLAWTEKVEDAEDGRSD